MRKINLIICLLILATIHSFAQSKEDYIWVSGNRNGSLPRNIGIRLDYNTKPLKIHESDNKYGFDRNNASICDKNGKLLFYSNGCAVLNADAEVMPNGDSLNWDFFMKIYGWESCYFGYPGYDNIIIIPDPAHANGYYLIHKLLKYNGPDSETSVHFRYTYIDMALNDGEGDVTQKNKSLCSESNLTFSYLAAIKHKNKRDWWVIQPKVNDSTYLTLLFDQDGIKCDSQSTGVFLNKYRSSGSGTAKFSPDGTKFALYNYYDQLHIYDFDRETGKLSNHVKVEIYNQDSINIEDIRFSSVEWSPSGRFVYVASTLKLHQIDTENNNEILLIDTYKGQYDPFQSLFCLMSLSPDCRIYLSPISGTYSYHVINKPDELGTACDFVTNAIKLPYGKSTNAFPNFPRFRVDEVEKCDPTIVSVFGDYVWYRKAIKVWPNPSSGLFNIELPDVGAGKLVVTNINGQVLFEKDASNIIKDERIDISGYPAGRYNIEFYPKSKTKERVFYGAQVVKSEK